ncbi:hypothetical protein F5Y17DRAFT_30921 [Xylariaceae sp. FL0594]|nr:hypothetical protein F5Y17DRAFT_30921 [Xylariaceae sp. FL0594]
MLPCALVMVAGASLAVAPVGAFSASPRMKQLMRFDALNPADLGNIGGFVGDDSFQLLGDLATIDFGNLTQAGRDITELLMGLGAPESDVSYTDVPPLNSTACAQDTCCVWKYIAEEMTVAFRGKSGRCTKWARKAVRLGFHDAGAWSKVTAQEGGGADGSICLTDEVRNPENAGLEDMCEMMRGWYDEWNGHMGYNVSMADMIRKLSLCHPELHYRHVHPIGNRALTHHRDGGQRSDGRLSIGASRAIFRREG